jgi:hypothetical protein
MKRRALIAYFSSMSNGRLFCSGGLPSCRKGHGNYGIKAKKSRFMDSFNLLFDFDRSFSKLSG